MLELAVKLLVFIRDLLVRLQLSDLPNDYATQKSPAASQRCWDYLTTFCLAVSLLLTQTIMKTKRCKFSADKYLRV